MEVKIFYGFHGREVSVDDLIVGMEGWREIITTLVDELFSMGWNGHLLQIKEKWGELRFYIEEGTDEMFDRISQAEAQSGKTCMLCGKPGKPTGWGWVLTLCDEHKVKTGKNDELLDLDSNSDSAAV